MASADDQTGYGTNGTALPVRNRRHGNGRKPRPAPPTDESRAEQILRVAGLLFRTKGYPNTTMREIAQAADLTPGALYWHFSSKEEILYQHLLTYEQPWFGAAHDAAREGPPDRQLRGFVCAYVRYQIEHPLFALGWGILARTGQLAWYLSPEQQEQFRQLDRDIVADLEAILALGVEADVFRPLDIHLTANAIINMCHVLGAWVQPVGEIDVASLPDAYADLILHMVATGSTVASLGERSERGSE
jgi:AcrR family transcriptional regulator